MAIEKVTTSDGVKLRDTRSGQLVGSVGTGVTPPSTSPGISASSHPYAPAEADFDAVARDLAAKNRMREALTSIAADLHTTPDLVRAALDDLTVSHPDAFEDVDVPDVRFRYHEDPLLVADPEATPELARAWRKLGYEQYLAQPYPVFVYGTLRPGQGNHTLMARAVDTYLPAQMYGVGIYGAHRGFPYASEHEDPEAFAVGEVVWLDENPLGRQARENLDALEGFSSDSPSSSHYERVLRTVRATQPDGTVAEVQAWTYLARGWSRSQLQESDRIVDGDWVAAKNAYRAPRPRYDMGTSRSFDDNPWIV